MKPTALPLPHAPTPPFAVRATASGAVVSTPAGGLELRHLARGAWEWLGEDQTRRPLIRAAQA